MRVFQHIKVLFLLKKRRHLFNFFMNMETFLLLLYIYLCQKHCDLICWIYKNIIIFSLFTPRFFIQKLISILERFFREVGVTHQSKHMLRRERGDVKWTEKKKRDRGSKIRRIEWTWGQVLFAAAKIYDKLIFNLAHSLISL